MNKKNERINKIVNILKVSNVLSIHELADQLNVSEMTIRRDLTVLEEDKVIRLLHGGAVLNPNSRIESNKKKYQISSEESINLEAKIRIGQKAASLIEPDDIIIIDSGSTTEHVAKSIPQGIPLTVLCYALNILVETHNKTKCRLIFGGGYFHDNTLMFESPEGLELIRRNRANKAFISAGGVNDKLGVTCYNPYEMETKRGVIGSSLSRILLVDSSKFGKICPAYFADLDDFNVVISDTGIPDDYRNIIQDAGITLHVV